MAFLDRFRFGSLLNWFRPQKGGPIDTVPYWSPVEPDDRPQNETIDDFAARVGAKVGRFGGIPFLLWDHAISDDKSEMVRRWFLQSRKVQAP